MNHVYAFMVVFSAFLKGIRQVYDVLSANAIKTARCNDKTLHI